MEAHDTEPDAARPERLQHKRLVRVARPEREPTPVAPRGPRGPVLAGAPISEDERMRAGSVARVRVREALVKVQHSLAEEAEELRAPAPRPPSFSLPEVRVAWLRTTDRAQRLLRYGADGLVIRGIADGTAAQRPGSPPPSIAVGIDGLIFRVPLEHGDTARETAERLVARLGPTFELEIVESRDEQAIIRLVAPRDSSHT